MKMKLLLTYVLTIFTFASWAQTDLGVGLVSIDYNDKTVLSFYTDTTDKKPTKTVEFFNDKSIDSWNIRNLNTHKQWLSPEVLWLDYNSFVFRCKMQASGWYAVIANNQTGKVYWLKKSKWTKFLSWEKFLKEMFSVERLLKQKIRSLPNEDAKEIKYSGEDCFQVRSMKGDWIEIFTTDFCDDEDTKSKTKIKSGWIKWREGNKLLINYFITS
jgi:hypothetical protein